MLRAHHLTVDDLRSQIAARFGVTVDARTLAWLTRDGRVRRPKSEIVAVAAATLGVGLAASGIAVAMSQPPPPTS